MLDLNDNFGAIKERGMMRLPDGSRGKRRLIKCLKNFFNTLAGLFCKGSLNGFI